jgi:hypothetical protein
MNTKKIISALFILHYSLFITSCAAPDKIGSLDLVQWRNDRGGCKGKRIAEVKNFEATEPQLLSKHIDTITKMLGRPDSFELDARDQKSYTYYFENGPKCQNEKTRLTAKRVLLKFNAVGLLSEISYPVSATANGESTF